jgi:hypothetical protein
MNLLADNELPAGFSYPPQFKRFIETGVVGLEPWFFLSGPQLRSTAKGLSGRYKDRNLIPFARRQDNDDIACWQVGEAGRVVVIHDFASSGWEVRSDYPGFYDWLRAAINDFVDFDT